MLPDENTVRLACTQFDRENRVVEDALSELFGKYPTNDSEAHVLLKVVTLNRLYSTQIFAVHDVAHHIYTLGAELDVAMKAGAPGIVDKIAKVIIASTGKERSNYSFATKYCSWHNASSYPLWDSRVCRYLASLKSEFFVKADRWQRYSEFVALMSTFRAHYKLDSFGFKDIDKFLWIHGSESEKREDETASLGASDAFALP